jgi:hypothetical protein
MPSEARLVTDSEKPVAFSIEKVLVNRVESETTAEWH